MIQWWESLDTLRQIFMTVAVSSTLVMIVQTIMLLVGLGDGDGDVDSNGMLDGDAGDGGLALFSVRGIVTMLAVSGWSGFALLETIDELWAIIIAIVLGVLSLVGMAYLMRAVYRMQASGNLDVENAIGKVATVYIPIPAKSTGSGKVTITLQEKYCEMDAITTNANKLTTGTYVRVVAVDGVGTLVVEPLEIREAQNEA